MSLLATLPTFGEAAGLGVLLLCVSVALGFLAGKVAAMFRPVPPPTTAATVLSGLATAFTPLAVDWVTSKLFRGARAQAAAESKGRAS